MLKKYLSTAPNAIVSDIGAGYGHMKGIVKGLRATWEPFDYVKKIDDSITCDVNNEAPSHVKNAGVVVFLEVLEHFNNTLLGSQNITKHLDKNGILILTTLNPQASKHTLS